MKYMIHISVDILKVKGQLNYYRLSKIEHISFVVDYQSKKYSLGITFTLIYTSS